MKKSKNKGKSKLRIKPMKYTLMELRKTEMRTMLIQISQLMMWF